MRCFSQPIEPCMAHYQMWLVCILVVTLDQEEHDDNCLYAWWWGRKSACITAMQPALQWCLAQAKGASKRCSEQLSLYSYCYKDMRLQWLSILRSCSPPLRASAFRKQGTPTSGAAHARCCFRYDHILVMMSDLQLKRILENLPLVTKRQIRRRGHLQVM